MTQENAEAAHPLPQVRMVSKVGAAPQSPEVLAKASGTFYRGSDCVGSLCRWGEYAGATPDPTPRLRALAGVAREPVRVQSGHLQRVGLEALELDRGALS